MSATDRHLQGSSVAIDAGTAAGAPATDLEGRTRPLDGNGIGGAQQDMGAYEYALTIFCGDGILQAGEACDSGAANGTYGACDWTCTALGPRCGDSTRNGPEACDDGNTVNTDSCSNTCTAARCGDAIVQAGEECDDGNTAATNACTASCTNARCGDGFRQVGVEACDDGHGDGTDACLTTCQTGTSARRGERRAMRLRGKGNWLRII